MKSARFCIVEFHDRFGRVGDEETDASYRAGNPDHVLQSIASNFTDCTTSARLSEYDGNQCEARNFESNCKGTRFFSKCRGLNPLNTAHCTRDGGMSSRDCFVQKGRDDCEIAPLL